MSWLRLDGRVCAVLAVVGLVACAEDLPKPGAGDGSGGPTTDGGTTDRLPDVATGTGCARFGYEVSGNSCLSTGCLAFRCDCPGGFPRSITACTADGCVVAGNCVEVCAAPLQEATSCANTTYSV